MRNILEANRKLSIVNQLIKQKRSVQYKESGLLAGIDLGTSSIVLVVIDQKGTPVYAASTLSSVVRDGLVVDYIGAITIVRNLKQDAELSLGVSLKVAAGAVPPGTYGNNRQVIKHILEESDFECKLIIDEPTAAAKVLNFTEGAIVDVGGGTMGISILQNNRVIYTADEATGGHQMTLVIAGYYGISCLEAENIKCKENKESEIFQIIKPVVEKMALISHGFINDSKTVVKDMYLVGGATNFNEFLGVFKKELGINIYKCSYPEYVTPLGIALSLV